MTPGESTPPASEAAAIEALLRAEIADLRSQLETRFHEIATLTALLEDAEARSTRALQAQALRLERLIPLRGLLAGIARAAWDNGPAEGTAPAEAQGEALRASPLFDADWYLARYPDVPEAGLDPAAHYIRAGAFEGRDPGPLFSSMDYYLANPDVAAAGWPALSHYLMFGQAEGRLRDWSPETGIV